MNIWENAVITQKGLALQAKLVQGNTLEITRAAAGSGYVAAGLLQRQTAVTSEEQILQITSAVYPEDGKCAITTRLENEELEKGYTAMQIGLYAKDPDEGEILYFIAQANSGTGVTVPAHAEMASFHAEWTFYFQYGMADGVSVTVDPANTVTQAMMEQYINSEILVATDAEIEAAFNAAE